MVLSLTDVAPSLPGLARVRGRLLEGVGDLNPDWMRLNVIGDVLVSRLAGTNTHAPIAALSPGLSAALAAVRLDVDAEHLTKLIGRLSAMGLFAQDEGQLRLSVPAPVAATKLEAVSFIRDHLRSGLGAAREDAQAGGARLAEILRSYGEAAEIWALDPVEARWPVLKAVATMLPRERAELAAFLRTVGSEPHSSLADSLSLMLENPIPADWLARHAPELVGRDVMLVTPEGLFNAAGGLGRVTQYHSGAMTRLAGTLATIWVFEPMYGFRAMPGKESHLERVDYAALARDMGAGPLEHVRSLSINVRGRDVPVEVHRSRLRDGRVACLLGDPTEYFARVIYAYGRFGQASWAEFSEWLSEGAVAAIAAEMRERKVTRGEAYRPPLISAHDAQTALVPEVKLRLDQSGDPVLWEAREYFTTHTILNRPGEDLESMGIPQSHRWAGDRMGWLDATSFGIRIADGRNAVSSAHAAEIEAIDPGFDIVAVSNGTNTSDFEDTLRDTGALDVRNPTIDDIAGAKQVAKLDLASALGIPSSERADFASRLLVSYSGRMVSEKVSRGENGALVDGNLRELTRQGVVVVIYGNVQPASLESRRLFNELTRLSADLMEEGCPGRLLVRTGWSQRDQIELLKATDLQVQVSDSIRSPNLSFRDGKPVGTEAAGYTEAPVGRFAGLQMGPVEVHGLLNRAGTLIDWSRPGSGSVLLAREPTSAAYLDELLTAAHHFEHDPDLFYSMGQKAYALGAINDALMTAAEYLRQFSKTWQPGPPGATGTVDTRSQSR
jgi:Starch synthase catalytic domain